MSTRSSHGRSNSPTDMLAVRDDGHRSHTLLSTYPSHSRQKIRAHVSSVLRKTLASLNTCHMVIKVCQVVCSDSDAIIPRIHLSRRGLSV